MTNEEKLLKVAIEKKALTFGKFKLSAGGTSNYYFDGRLLTLDPEGAYLTAKCLIPIVNKSGANFIAGPTLGADPIVASVAAVSYLEKTPISALIVRKEAKGHGTQAWIEGPLPPVGSKVVVLEDVVTTGGSAIKAAEKLRDAGYIVERVVAIVDRQEGKEAYDAMEAAGLDVVSLFLLEELL